jgi:four helix bundle protein
MQNFEKLRCWHLAKNWSADIARNLDERTCRKVPGLRSQIIGAAISVSLNIAEGAGRGSPQDFRRFIDMSLGSLLESMSALNSAVTSGVISRKTFRTLNDRAVVLRRMLWSLRETLNSVPDTTDLRHYQKPPH